MTFHEAGFMYKSTIRFRTGLLKKVHISVQLLLPFSKAEERYNAPYKDLKAGKEATGWAPETKPRKNELGRGEIVNITIEKDTKGMLVECPIVSFDATASRRAGHRYRSFVAVLFSDENEGGKLCWMPTQFFKRWMTRIV
ncbi:MAG: hypothetical protein WC761_00340 [Candidatus Paceibacterota bacterium]|jgi:hypothetical protein